MNILFLNNYHYLRGGSERVFFDEMQLLVQHGHKATAFARKHAEHISSECDNYFPADIKTDSIDLSWGALRTLKEIFYSGKAKGALDQLLKQFPPDIAHAHNIYGRLTTSVLDLLYEKGIPVLMTLHDYKLICPTYLLMCNGHICEDCKGGKFYMAVRNRCHKDSWLASAIYTLESYFNQWLGKYRRNIKLFIAPSLFMRDKFIEFGWPESQIEYIPNFIDLFEFPPQYERGDYFVCLGRLSSEKGLFTLVEAFKRVKFDNARLLLVGEGPIRRRLEKLANGDLRIRFTGYLSGNELRQTTRQSLAVIIPSECYENAPVSILESMALGKPVIASRIGGIPEMIVEGVNGYLFEPGSVDDLEEKIDLILSKPDSVIMEMGRSGRKKIERDHTSELHYERLMTVYRRALQRD